MLENFVATWPLIIIAFFEVIVICWVYGSDNFLDNVRWMISYYPPIYLLWKVVWKFLCPLIFLVILTFVWLEYRPVSYDGVPYPTWAIILGWSISAVPLLLIFVTAIFVFCRAQGGPIERWQRLLCPEDDWGPALAVHRAEYYPLQIPEARRLMPIRFGQIKKVLFELYSIYLAFLFSPSQQVQLTRTLIMIRRRKALWSDADDKTSNLYE